LSRGFEQLPITVEDPTDGRLLPAFHYITKSIVFDKIPVNPHLKMLGADVRCATCKADSYEDLEPCKCAGEMKGQFAYTEDGLLKDVFLDKVQHSSRASQSCPCRSCYQLSEVADAWFINMFKMEYLHRSSFTVQEVGDTKFYAARTGCYCIQVANIMRRRPDTHACASQVPRTFKKNAIINALAPPSVVTMLSRGVESTGFRCAILDKVSSYSSNVFNLCKFVYLS
jgi:hypothetical protein